MLPLVSYEFEHKQLESTFVCLVIMQRYESHTLCCKTFFLGVVGAPQWTFLSPWQTSGDYFANAHLVAVQKNGTVTSTTIGLGQFSG